MLASDLIALIPNLIDPNSPNMQESCDIINNARIDDLNSFLTTDLEILKSTNVNISICIIAMVLAYQSFPYPPVLEENPFERVSQEVIQGLLDTASACFSHEHPSVRSCAATLYSHIACTDILTTGQYQTLASLISCLQGANDVVVLSPLSIVLTDLFSIVTLNEDEVNLVLEALLTHCMNEQIDDEIRNNLLLALGTIIDNIGEILSENNNVEQIFNSLLILTSNQGTKAAAFACWSEITIHYYPMLEYVAQQIVNSSFYELSDENNSREILLNACMFWESLSECEKDKDAHLNIIQQVAPQLIPIMFNMIALVPYQDCDEEETFEPHVAAGSALQNIVAAEPEVSYPILANLIDTYIQSDNFGQRDSALSCLNFVIQFCDVSPIMDSALQIIYNCLSDTAPRVKQTAIYCVHALLQSILNKGDNCPFAPLIPKIGHNILHMADVVIGLINDIPGVAATACLTTADFIQFPGFPHIGSALTALINASLQRDLLLSSTAFSAIQNSIPNASVTICQILLKAILTLLEVAINDHADSWLIVQFYGILQGLFIKLSGQINDHVEKCWTLLNSTFQIYPEEAPNLLAPLSSLARASGQLFAPYIDNACEFIIEGLNMLENSSAISSAAVGVSLLSDSFDLSNYALPIFTGLQNIIIYENADIETKRFATAAIADLAKSIPNVFAQVASDVMPCIILVTESLSDIFEIVNPDDEEIDIELILISYLRSLLKCVVSMTHVGSDSLSTSIEATLDLLEVIGGMKEHGDDILTASVETMAFLANTFPDMMKDYFQDEPGYLMLVREAEEAKLLPEIISVLSQFFE